jgi:hypothetical protein
MTSRRGPSALAPAGLVRQGNTLYCANPACALAVRVRSCETSGRRDWTGRELEPREEIGQQQEHDRAGYTPAQNPNDGGLRR